jgi:hypothetical protein
VTVFEWQGNGGSVGLFYHDKASGPVALTIDDPLRPGANIGAGSFNMHRVQVHDSWGFWCVVGMTMCCIAPAQRRWCEWMLASIIPMLELIWIRWSQRCMSAKGRRVLRAVIGCLHACGMSCT